MNANAYGVVGAVFLILGLIVLGPIIVIWSLNTLFATGIALSFKTWFAALVLSGAVGGSVSRSNKK